MQLTFTHQERLEIQNISLKFSNLDYQVKNLLNQQKNLKDEYDKKIDEFCKRNSVDVNDIVKIDYDKGIVYLQDVKQYDVNPANKIEE